MIRELLSKEQIEVLDKHKKEFIFLERLVEILGKDALLEARRNSMTNMTTTFVENTSGTLLGGKLTIRVEFDERK